MTDLIVVPAVEFIREARKTDPHLSFILLLTDDGSTCSYALRNQENHHLIYLSTLEYTAIRATFIIEGLGGYESRDGKHLHWYKVKAER